MRWNGAFYCLISGLCRCAPPAEAEATEEAEEAGAARCKHTGISQTNTADTPPTPPAVKREHALLFDVLHMQEVAARSTESHLGLGGRGDCACKVSLSRFHARYLDRQGG